MAKTMSRMATTPMSMRYLRRCHHFRGVAVATGSGLSNPSLDSKSGAIIGSFGCTSSGLGLWSEAIKILSSDGCLTSGSECESVYPWTTSGSVENGVVLIPLSRSRCAAESPRAMAPCGREREVVRCQDEGSGRRRNSELGKSHSSSSELRGAATAKVCIPNKCEASIPHLGIAGRQTCRSGWGRQRREH